MINSKMENALRQRIQRRYGDVFVTVHADTVRVYVDRKHGQTVHTIFWMGFAAFDRDVKQAVVGGAA